MRISSLAKELEKESKDLIAILEKNGVVGKKAQSGVDDNEIQMIKDALAPKKENLVKKKKIIFVNKPQNSNLSSNSSGYSNNNSAKRGSATTAKDVADAFNAALNKNSSDVSKSEEPKVVEEVKPISPQPRIIRRAEDTKTEDNAVKTSNDQTGDRYNDQRTQSNREYNNNRPQGNKEYNNNQRPQGNREYNNNQRPQGNREYNNNQRPQGNREYNNNRPQGNREYNNNRPNNDRPRPNGDRPYNSQGPRNDGNRSYNGPRPDGDRNNGPRRQGEGYNNNRDNGYQRTSNGQGGGYNNNRNSQYSNANSNRGNGFNGGRSQGNDRDRERSKSSFGSDGPMMQQQDRRRDDIKRNKANQDRDSRSKRDKIYEEDQVITKKSGMFIKPEKKVEVVEEIKVITIPEILTLKELADKMRIQPSAIVKKLFLQGQVVTVNQEISYEQAEEIAIEYEIMCEQEVKVNVIEELLKEDDEDPNTMTKRPPVICVMGHVDHGKTSLLDAIRKTNVTDREAGGITQHIGAYMVKAGGEKITFLDTPGHEAFTSMRMRGANSTDIAILVVAADDGVMPQTIEAINHAKAAGIEIIVAINKIDKPNANPERVKQELTEYELIPEDWGGSTVFAPVSAKSGEGIEQLLEMILLTAEILELKANAKRSARGLVIEAQLDKGRGPVATVLVQKGTLKVGDFIAAGSCHGKVRAMLDDKGRRVKEASPSMPIEILGLNDVPAAGDVFVAPENDKEARQFAATFISQNRERMLEDTKAKMSLDDLFTQIQAGNLKELNLIVKADVQGSVEAVKQSLLKLSNEEVVVKIIHSGVGAINESDVILASASQAIIIGFNVRPDATAKSTSERENVEVKLYKVIYQAIEDVQAAMKGMLDPIFEEKIIGHAEIRQIFKASAIGNIAGSYVLDGHFERGCKVRITRAGEQVFEGNLDSLKRFKDDVKEVKSGFECGLLFEGYDKFEELDIVEAYIMVEVPR